MLGLWRLGLATPAVCLIRLRVREIQRVKSDVNRPSPVEAWRRRVGVPVLTRALAPPSAAARNGPPNDVESRSLREEMQSTA